MILKIKYYLYKIFNRNRFKRKKRENPFIY